MKFMPLWSMNKEGLKFMRVENLVDLIIKQNQKELALDAVPDKKAYALSDAFFQVLKKDMLKEAFFEVKCALVKFVECGGSVNSREMLNKAVNEGYWVYCFTCSADFHQFEWFPTKEQATKAFDDLKLEWFLCRKSLIDTNKGVLKSVNLKELI